LKTRPILVAVMSLIAFTFLSTNLVLAQGKVEQKIRWETYAGNPEQVEENASLFAAVVSNALANSPIPMRVADLSVDLDVNKSKHGYAEHKVVWNVRLESCSRDQAHYRFAQFSRYDRGATGKSAEEQVNAGMRNSETIKRGFRKPRTWEEHKSSGNNELEHWCYKAKFFAEQR